MAVTIVDIAEKVGVASSTISRVLNNRPDAREVSYEPGLCPVAEDILPRIMLIGAAGGADAHKQNAESLAATIEKLS